MNQKHQAKISKNIQFAVLQIAHTYKSMITYPVTLAEDIINLTLSPLVREREQRLEIEAKKKQIEALPEWARATYKRDWDFESREDYIRSIRSEAGRRGGKVTKSV